MFNREKGAFAENIAAEYLESKSYKILFKNWTCRWGELDIVAEKEDKLIFVEVKYRKNSDFGDITESLSILKRMHLYRTISLFLKQEVSYKNKDNVAFDFICVSGALGSYSIKHYKSLSLL